ncbi:MAG: OmpA family protein [Bacteroidales bacterium]|nr:OmpA family protein [Bacteroidales bacterium]
MKHITIAIMILISAAAVKAQRQDTFLDFNAGYSIHDVNAKIKTGDKKLGGGLILYGGFGHFFSDHWGVTAGAKFLTAKTTTKLNFSDHLSRVEDNQVLLDDKSKNLDVSYDATKEQTKESVLYIPVGIAFRQMIGSKLSLEARMTAEPGFVLTQKYETVSGEINVVNSYINKFNGVDVRVENVSQLSEYGAGNAGHFSGDADMKKFIFGTGASVGIVMPVAPRLALTANVYGSYTFTDQKNQDYPHVFDGVKYVGLAQSNLCSKIHPFTTGVSVGVRVFLGKDKEQPLPPDDNIEVQPTEPQVAEVEVVKDTVTVDIRDIVGVGDNETKTEPEQPVVTEPVMTLEQRLEAVRKMLIDIEPITFELGKTQTAKDREKIDQIAAIMKENPDMKFLVVGHTCNIGSLQVNRTVGQQRANSLRDELLKRDVPASQLSIESRWYKEPLVPNTSEANRKRNRRVEVELMD